MKLSKILLISTLLSSSAVLPYTYANPMKDMMDSAGDMVKSGADAASDVVESTSDAVESMVDIGAEKTDDKTFKWSHQLIQSVGKGDAARGKTLAKKAKCAKCHGDTGISDEDDTPSIAGQIPAYSYKLLHEYKVKILDSKSMYKKVKDLSNQDMIDISTWYATQKPEKKAGGKIPKLAEKGDEKRFLLSCNSCHNKDAIERGFQTPFISGQKVQYFIDTMMAFKEEERTNDHYRLMRSITSRLTEEEIEELAAYYGAPASKDDDDDDDE
ncbi:MAG: c-type cytochrome [Thiotrichaceae bacterium]|nr:c-type cytochrome [Thiotrichaceae bacterium]